MKRKIYQILLDWKRRHNISPIEVKGTGVYATKSLDKFASKYSAYLGDAYVIHEKNLKCQGRRISIPPYMAGLL